MLLGFTTRTGKKVYLGARAYHMPASDVQLESPQSVSQGLGGGCYARIDGYQVKWHMPDGEIIDIPIDPRSNLPLCTILSALSPKREDSDHSMPTKLHQSAMKFNLWEKHRHAHECTPSKLERRKCCQNHLRSSLRKKSACTGVLALALRKIRICLGLRGSFCTGIRNCV